MKKWLMLFLLICTVCVAGDEIKRYSDFPLDNIHILRLQEAASSLGGNVSALNIDQQKYLEVQAQRMNEMESSMRSFQRTMLSQMNQLQNSLQNTTVPLTGAVAGGLTGAQATELDLPAPPEQPVFPEEQKISPLVVGLLGLNVFLLILVIILIFWLREQYRAHEKKQKAEHIHPAPKALVDYVFHALQHDTNIKDIRMELAKKGWSPSIIEHAINAAKERAD